MFCSLVPSWNMRRTQWSTWGERAAKVCWALGLALRQFNLNFTALALSLRSAVGQLRLPKGATISEQGSK
jgi:hypothetical protein